MGLSEHRKEYRMGKARTLAATASGAAAGATAKKGRK